MNSHQRLVLGLALCATLGLAACSAGQPHAPESTAPASAAPGQAESETPLAQEREVPASCAALDLAPGAQLDGSALGACVSEALSSYGSGTMRLTAETSGDVEFSYDPEYSFQAELQGPDGPLALTFLEGTMWIDSGSGPIKGDVDSEDPAERLAGVAGELYRFYSDLEQTAQLVASQPVWHVDAAMDQVTLPTGESVPSYRIVSDGPFAWNEIPVGEFILWFGEDWLPVGDQASMDLFGVSGTHTQHFYDLGEPVTITPPS